MKDKKRTPYSIIKSAVDKSFMPTKEELSKINSFFLVRYISNDPNTIYIANTLNCNVSFIPIEAQYKFVRESTLNKVAFINYPKKDKKYSKQNIKLIKTHYKCNDRIAKEYIDLMPEEEINKLLQQYETILK